MEKKPRVLCLWAFNFVVHYENKDKMIFPCLGKICSLIIKIFCIYSIFHANCVL